MFSIFIRLSALGVCAMLSLALSAQVQAGIVLNTTRVIYSGADKEVSLQVHNTGASEILAQTWIEADQTNTASTVPPFALTPALARMSGDARQLIRIIYAGEGLSTDRESVLWLNVQEIPQTASENALQIAIRQRIKLFYRPRGLGGDPLKTAQGLQWQLRNGQLEVTNPSPYHVSMIKLEGVRRGQVMFKEESRMLAPGEQRQWRIDPSGNGPLALTFISINDFGAQESYRASVGTEKATEASRVAPLP